MKVVWCFTFENGHMDYRYPDEYYRVSVESGALIVRIRKPDIIYPGDNDMLVAAYGHGAWKSLTREECD